ncbi:MAG: methyltransferase domain-containing protein [Pseudonocardiaceae bacterium]
MHRDEFIPETVWVESDGAVLAPLRRTQDPKRWLDLAYADDAVITQVDDGHPTPEGTGHRISSSASMPTVVAQMLAPCAAQPGQRVLEIGTGTGYNAALLAHRLGASNVVTIEIDSDLAQTARCTLKAAGYDPVTVVTGDGAQGYPPAAPFDRVLSTAAIQQVPYNWVKQTRPGGLVITPWGTDYYNGGLLVLTVTHEHTAVGSIVDKASFMALRQQRFTQHGLTLTADDDAHAACSHTDIHPAEIANGRIAFDACIALAIRVPHCAMSYAPPRNSTPTARASCGSSTLPPDRGPGCTTTPTATGPTASCNPDPDAYGTKCTPTITGGSTLINPPRTAGASPSPPTDNTLSS